MWGKPVERISLTLNFIDLFGDVAVEESFNVHRGEEGMENEVLKFVNSDT